MEYTGTGFLTTKNLTLGPVEADDAFYMYENVLSHVDEMKYISTMSLPSVSSVEETEEAIEEISKNYSRMSFYLWQIVPNDLEQPVGIVKVSDDNSLMGIIELELVMGPEFSGKGYEVETLEAMIGFFVKGNGASRLSLRLNADDMVMRKACEKAGFVYEGTLRKVRIDEGISDEAVYSVIPEDFAVDFEEEEEPEEMTISVVSEIGADGKKKNVISDETMEYVGILAKLELSEEEAQAAKKDMEAMLDYIDELNELDTTGIEPMSHVFPVNNVFREDVVTNGDGSADTLKNAPVVKDGGFKVPKTIGE